MSERASGSAQPLGRVLDPRARDHADVPRALSRIEVPERYAGRTVRVTLPRRLVCAACEGGGCDACGRRGAFTLPESASGRRVELTLPSRIEPKATLRIERPLDTQEPELLLLELVLSDEPSEAVELVGTLQRRAPGVGMRGAGSSALLIGTAVAMALATLVGILQARGC